MSPCATRATAQGPQVRLGGHYVRYNRSQPLSPLAGADTFLTVTFVWLASGRGCDSPQIYLPWRHSGPAVCSLQALLYNVNQCQVYEEHYPRANIIIW